MDEPRRRHAPRSLSPAVALTLLFAACGGPPSTPPGSEALGLSPELEALPRPAIETFEAPVREQFEAAFARLDAAAGDDRAAAHGELANLAYTYEFLDLAAPAYRNAVRLQPGEPRWPYYLGQLELGQGRLDEAAAALSAAAAMRPDDPAVLAALAQTLREAGDLEGAEAASGRLLEVAPDHPVGLLVSAELAMDRGDADAALRTYQTLLARQPEATRLYGPVAAALRAAGRDSEADALATRQGDGKLAIEDPWMAELRELLRGSRAAIDRAQAAFADSDFETAVAAFREALEHAPDDLDTRRNLAASLLHGKHNEEALAEYERLVEIDPDSALNWFQYGVAASRNEDDASARRAYARALEIDPGHRGARFNLANLDRRDGLRSEALAGYRALAEQDGGDARARLGEAVLLVELERWSEARARIKEGLQALPHDMALAQLGARLLAACPDAEVRDGEQALGLAEQLMMSSRSLEHHQTLAMALAELGRFDGAVSVQSAALEMVRDSDLPAAKMRVLEEQLAAYEAGRPWRDPNPR